TPAVLDEIHSIRQAGALARTMFVIPPVPADERRLRLAMVASALDLDPDLLLESATGRHRLGFFFDPAGRLAVVEGRGRADFAVPAAVDAMVAEVGGQRTQRRTSPAADLIRPTEPVASAAPVALHTSRVAWPVFVVVVGLSFLGYLFVAGETGDRIF